MTEEIKEMLDRLDFNEWEVDLYKVPITWAELYDVRDYITNLQKENEKLKETLQTDKLMKAFMVEHNRNEKAIEWCECVVNAKYTADKLPNGKTTDMGYCLDLAEPLLNILQGGDE